MGKMDSHFKPISEASIINIHFKQMSFGVNCAKTKELRIKTNLTLKKMSITRIVRRDIQFSFLSPESSSDGCELAN